MNYLELDFLKNLKGINNAEDIKQFFYIILEKLQSFLKLEVIHSQIKIFIRDEEFTESLEEQNILNLGVKRFFQNNKYNLIISNTCEKFLPIILLREAYYCFVPSELSENENIKIFINQIIENDLKELEIIKDWKVFIRKSIVDYDFISAEFDKLEKFFMLQSTRITESPVQFFFKYIRRNVFIIDGSEVTKKEFYDKLFEEFVFKTSKNLKDDEIIETIRVIINIFYKVKSYRTLLDYKEYFKEFKKRGFINTSLSLRKFSSNIQWINNFTYIAPNYNMDWNSIGMCSIFFCLRFNPFLGNAKIIRFIEKLPMLLSSKSSKSNFSIDYTGWFVIPKVYLNDLITFFNKLEQFGYIIEKRLIIYHAKINNLNLNYFRSFYKKGRIINPNHIKYDKNFEITFEHLFSEKFQDRKFTILDFLIFDRIQRWAITGFPFERRTDTIRKLKSDLFNEIISQRSLIKNLKDNLKIFFEHKDIQAKLLKFLKENQNFGFFYIKEMLENLLSSLELIEPFLNKNLNVKTISQFQVFLKEQKISHILEENILIEDVIIKKILFREILPIYFENKNQYKKVLLNYIHFRDFFKSCYDLKIFNIKIMYELVKDNNLVEKIFRIKEDKLKKSYEKYKIRDITSNLIEDLLESYLKNNPPIIKPILITTINTTSFANYHIQMILKNTISISNKLGKLKSYFPRLILNPGNNFLHVDIYLPNLKVREKELFISILYNLFKKNIISIKRYFFTGFFNVYSGKAFYAFEKGKFFYSRDLFEQYFLYAQRLFSNNLKNFKEIPFEREEIFWSKEKNMSALVNIVNDRISREKINIDINLLNELLEFHLNLKGLLLNKNVYDNPKLKTIISQYIKSISFFPIFQKFGFGKYYLYIKPINLSEIDFKLLLSNNFLSIKFPASIGNTKSFLIKYIFPYEKPNLSYINWLIKSKKVIAEYSLLFVKKVFIILHFDYNLESNGWSIDANKFKSYVQKILFDKKFQIQIQGIKEIPISNLSFYDFYSPESPYYYSLTKLHKYKPENLKTIIRLRKSLELEDINLLLKNNLIYPYLKLKNLGFQEKIYIFLPNLTKDLKEILIKIFSFFNYGFIYEISGELFLYGFDDKKNFENGLFVKLYLPFSDLSEFQKVFDKLFYYLKINNYFILSDLIKGYNLLKSIYGNLEFLGLYNPLKNLIWSEKDKQWMNHKLFKEEFKPNYPNLI
ncbi:MAG: hypothetical protein ACTSQJ_11065 [Promethearchaeota archaeon]